MAFICTASHSKLFADVARDGNSYAILVHVGYDDVNELNYFAQVGLEISGGGGLEYYFNIIKVDSNSGDEVTYWSGKDVARFISQDDRADILGVICSATKALLTKVRPERVSRVTHDENLPDKALEKHHAISRVFKECGYEVAAADAYHGKRIWFAERL